MKAEEYLPIALQNATGRRVNVHPVRLPAGVGLPSIVWRMRTGYEPEGPHPYHNVLDGSASLQRFFEIECRAEQHAGATAMADDVLAELAPVSTGTFSRYDEADDSSQKQSQPEQDQGAAGYFSHIVEIGLPDIGLPEITLDPDPDPAPAG